MSQDIGRRAFIKLASGAGVALACAAQKTKGGFTSPAAAPPVPRRPFGRSGITVSELCLGGSSVMGTGSGALLDQALRHGIDCWEFNPFTGPVFGTYFKTHPGVRDRVFLSAKAHSANPAVMQEDLERALVTNQTSVIDFFAVHGVDDVRVLNDDVRRWAEKAKQEGKIRFFGFCTHKRVESCLEGAAGLSWIDGIQAFYNYRMQALGSSETALHQCHAKGIAVFAVKSMGLGVKHETEMQDPISRERLQTLLAGHGLGLAQAKLRSLWQNPNLTSVCSLMPTVAIMRANAQAAQDESPLHAEVTQALAAFAKASGPSFCRRCGTCDTATAERIPIFNVMECLMYSRAYGAQDLATRIFTQIPAELRAKLPFADFSHAEGLCPQKMPIAQLMKEAHSELGN
jgi:uncharacterized protein